LSLSDLPVPPPVAPMLAKLERDLPAGNYIYEPKWDGFRCIVFRRGNDLELYSRNELLLTRYFPELVAQLAASLPQSAVVDGEIVVAGPKGLDFDALSQRVHPAESRVQMLAERVPASFVAFDLVALGDRDLTSEPFHSRRELLESAFGPAALGARPAGQSRLGEGSTVRLTPATRDRSLAADWFRRFEGAGLDGVVAKPEELGYVPGKRVMTKVKHERTAEFVVGGFRYFRGGTSELGSLLLGLYDRQGRLAHVGVIGAFPAAQRRALMEVIAPYRVGPGNGLEQHPWGQWANIPATGQRLPGARSRWNATKDLSFEPLRPELVVEAAYEHLQGDRLRHTAHFRRWRPDRSAESCTYEQLEVAVPIELAEVFGLPVPDDEAADAAEPRRP
jgi:ATP-dependent DNA ligase